MKKRFQSLTALLMVLVLLVSFFPQSMTAMAENATEQENAETGEAEDLHPIPVRTLTELQEENAAATASRLALGGTEMTDGEFRYRLLDDGTAAISAYIGKGSAVSVPLTLGGANVTAIASGAFGRGVEDVTIHGNVFYIENGAVPAKATVSTWQGSYAATWAQANGHTLRSMTEGVLYPNVTDMTDVLGRMTVLSDSLVRTSAGEAKRLSVGDSFVLTREEDDELFFMVTAKRPIGSSVYLTVEKQEITEVYSYRLFEGSRSVTHSFTVDEAGVNLEDGEVQAASEVFEHTKTETKSPYNKGEVTVPLGEKYGELVFSYEKTTTVTTAYRVVLENGKIDSGEMATEQNDTNTVELKYKYKGKFKKFEFDNNTDWDKRKEFLDVMKALRGKGKEEKVGSFLFPIVPQIGLAIEFTAFWGWEAGGSGSVTWDERTLNIYEYNPGKEAWVLNADKARSLNTPEPDITGSLYGKISGGVGINVLCLWVTSELQTKLAATLTLKVTMPFDPAACNTLQIDLDISLSAEVGFWITAGQLEFQLASVASAKITLLNVTLLNAHRSKAQGIHRAAVCAYSPMDYSVRFVTGTEWQPKSICFLKEGTYTYFPAAAKALAFSANSVWGNVDEVSVGEFDRISLNYIDHPDALDAKITLPDAPDGQRAK